MPSFDRRAFLGSSLSGLAAASLAPSLFAQEKKAKAEKKAATPPVVNKDPLASLFLTWQQDPTTTMTVQWVGTDSAADIRVARPGPAPPSLSSSRVAFAIAARQTLDR